MSSASRFDAPITLVGFTALSVEIRMKRSTPYSSAACAMQPRAAHVVLDRLARVLLHERHVFVRGGMEDDLGPVLAHDLCEPRRIGHIADDRIQAELLPRVFELQPDRVQAVLVALEHHQRRRLQPRDLPAQLGADRSAGAGHHDAPAADEVLQRIAREPDRRTRQEIFDRQAADLRQFDLAVDEIAKVRHAS